MRSIEQIITAMARYRYITDRPLATVLFLAQALKKPLFLEGQPGVGKTEVALVLSRLLRARLIRLQCYEGLDVHSALYEWNYPRQILKIRTAEATGQVSPDLEQTLFGEEFLIRRPLLEAILSEDPRPPVLLIDELDRADEEFEAFLLEILSDFQVSIPEIGTLKARRRPWVVITSNRTRDIHDALKRRCLYHWLEYPTREKEYQIILSRIPGIDQELAAQLARFMTRLRREDLTKKPGISETLDWAQALIHLHRLALDEYTVQETLGCILKYEEDQRFFREQILGEASRKEALFDGLSPRCS
ncbi:MAG: MoxR family ATPase [Desulfobacterota bacterium]|nr:MoxR family ATPase [Thermodesulfobacteriota bacterium]